MQFVSTIIIPTLKHPNFLSTCIRGLLQNSAHRHKIIIVCSFPRTKADDFLINPETQEKYQEYETISEYLNANAELLTGCDIETIDATDKFVAFAEKYRRGEIYADKYEIQDGVDIAFKNNIGIEHTDTDWIIPNWDDDFYPSPAWDDNLLYIADKYKRNRTIFIPTHVQPLKFDKVPVVKDIWSEFRHIACNRLMFPTDKDYVTDEEWTEFCQKWSRWRMEIEPCGLRDRLHWVPILYRKEHLEEVGLYSYKGSGYDVEFDTRFAEHRFFKAGSLSSFVGHKLHVVI